MSKSLSVRCPQCKALNDEVEVICSCRKCGRVFSVKRDGTTTTPTARQPVKVSTGKNRVAAKKNRTRRSGRKRVAVRRTGRVD